MRVMVARVWLLAALLLLLGSSSLVDAKKDPETKQDNGASERKAEPKSDQQQPVAAIVDSDSTGKLAKFAKLKLNLPKLDRENSPSGPREAWPRADAKAWLHGAHARVTNEIVDAYYAKHPEAPVEFYQRRCLNHLAPPQFGIHNDIDHKQACAEFEAKHGREATQLKVIARLAALDKFDISLGGNKAAAAASTTPKLPVMKTGQARRTALRGYGTFDSHTPALGNVGFLEAASRVNSKSPGNPQAKWSETHVPYYKEADLVAAFGSHSSPEAVKKAKVSIYIDWAINHIEARTCIRFYNLGDRFGYTRIGLHWDAGGGCATITTPFFREIAIEVHSSCHVQGVAHELMHALGFDHTQNRMDRDLYLNIHWDNIPRDWKEQYAQVKAPYQDYGPYDYQSIMHYSGNLVLSKNHHGLASFNPIMSERSAFQDPAELASRPPPVNSPWDGTHTFMGLTDTDATAVHTMYCPGLPIGNIVNPVPNRSAYSMGVYTAEPPSNGMPSGKDIVQLLCYRRLGHQYVEVPGREGGCTFVKNTGSCTDNACQPAKSAKACADLCICASRGFPYSDKCMCVKPHDPHMHQCERVIDV